MMSIDVVNNRMVKYYREKMGLSQSQFASFFEIELGTLRNWEQNRSKCPKYFLNILEKYYVAERLACGDSQLQWEILG